MKMNDFSHQPPTRAPQVIITGKKKKDSLLRKETLAEKINIKKNLRLKLYQQYNENKPIWQVERETRFNFSHS